MGAPHYSPDIRAQAGMVAQTSGRVGRGIVDVCRVGEVGASGINGATYVGATAGDQLGSAVSGVGEVTGDGFTDVAFGAPYTDPDVDGTIRTDAGTVYVVEGAATHSGPLRRGIVDVDRVGGYVAGDRLVGTQPNEHAGSSLAGTGDINGDGFADFVAGARGGAWKDRPDRAHGPFEGPRGGRGRWPCARRCSIQRRGGPLDDPCGRRERWRWIGLRSSIERGRRAHPCAGLTLRGQKGIRAVVGTAVEGCRFESISAVALDLTGGAHSVTGAVMDFTVGGGVNLAAGATLTMTLSKLQDLTATAATLSGSAVIENCLVTGAPQGIAVTSSGSLDPRHSTIASQTGFGVSRQTGGTVTVMHSILYANAGGDLMNVSCSNVPYSDVGTTNCSSTGNNLSANPQLTGDFHLASGSPCLDHGPNPAFYSGNPCLDLSGGPLLRDYDGNGLAQLDAGAYEETNSGLAPVEVTNVRWTTATQLTWDAAATAIEYHVYRGVISALSYASSGACRDAFDPVRTDLVLADAAVPAPSGQGFFYLVTAENGSGGEGTLGFGTCAEISSYAPCP